MSAFNTIQVRSHNISLIRRVLRHVDAMTKAQLAQMTGLSVATCGKILGDMVQTGEVMERELAASGGGRPPRLFAYNPMFSLVACLFPKTVDGVDSIVYEVRDAKSQTLLSHRLFVDHVDVAALSRLVDDLVCAHPAIRSVAVSVPGIIQDGTIGFCDIPALMGVNIIAALGRDHLAVVADNDTNLAALGYYSRCECGISLVYVIVPRKNCTGAGIVINGEVVRGATSFAGELSFIPLGVTRDQQFAGMSREDTLAYTTRLAAAIIPVLNPSTLVLAGGNLDAGEVERIRAHCCRCIPEEHVPQCIATETLDADCMKGLDLLANRFFL